MLTAGRVRLAGLAYFFTLFVPFAIYARANDGFTTGGGIPCIWRSLTGYPCPGCGLTRSLASLTEFQFVESLRFNPEGLVLTALVLASLIFPSIALSISTKVKGHFANYSVKKSMWFGFSVLAIVLILNIIRISTGFYPANS